MANVSHASDEARHAAWMRVYLTLGLLVFYFVGSNLPVPGINLAFLDTQQEGMGSGATARLSVLALGVMPWFNALICGEILTLLLPVVRRWRDTGEASYPRTIVIVALIFAAFQAYGVAIALEQFHGLVGEPGSVFLGPAALTLFGGSVVAMLLAHAISREGIGSGFWVVLLAPSLLRIPETLAQIAMGLRTGEYAAGTLLVLPLVVILATLVIVAVLRQREEAGLKDVGGVVWPPILAAVAINWVAAGLPITVNGQPFHQLLVPGQPLYSLLLAIVIVVIASAYAATAGFRGLGLKTGVMLATVVVLPDLAFGSLGLPPLIDGGSIIIAVAVLFTFAQVWQTPRNPLSSSSAQGGPQSQSL